MSGWGNPNPKPTKPAATIETPSVENVFAKIVSDIRDRLPDEETVVDVECTFKRISIEKSGIILALFSGDQKETSMEIKLATRVRKTDA